MTEYVEKEALIKAVCQQYKGTMNTFFAKPNDFVSMIEDAPTVDVLGVREARWKGAGMGDYYCSLCCATYSGGDEFNYCPNCGARMKGW